MKLKKIHLNYWLKDKNAGKDFLEVQTMLPIINSTGELNICIRFDLRKKVTVNQDQIDRIINQYIRMR